MDCARFVELLTDVQDGALEEPLRGEAARHLGECTACSALLADVGLVSGALSRLAPAIPDGLAERAAAAAWARRPRPAAVDLSSLRLSALVPRRVLAAAAGLTLLVSSAVYVGLRAHTDPESAPGRFTRRAVNTAVAARERGTRLAEDLRILRLVVGTAFEGRVERVNDRVDDYRKLLEKRRQASPAPPHQSDTAFYPNMASVLLVKSCES